MTLATWLLAAAAVPLSISSAGTVALIAALRRRAVVDIPNQRSSHTVPTPRGGGIAVVAAILISWLLLSIRGAFPSYSVGVLAGAAGLAVVSWIDDLRGLSQAVRLAAQFAAVAIGLWALPHGVLFQGLLPFWLDAAAAALLWVWFINLFNFMDGVDGIAATEAVAICVGLILIGTPKTAALAVPVMMACLGFLVWNWSPAKIFLGDVGSVPLGYLLGFLLYKLAMEEFRWQAALILPLYFIADASLTLLRRLARGERVWQAHREHFYQRAVQNGLSHAAVVLRVIVADVLLILCAVLTGPTFGWKISTLALAALVVLALLVELGRSRR
jgi:UDP-N-acetylmuramyl pentapeptide phosphotransferase/UDP-N-acetylglucosamine-1-phosphate transferase